MAPLSDQRMAELYRQGLSCRAVAEALGCDPTTVWKRLKALGLGRDLQAARRTERTKRLMSEAATKRLEHYNPMKDPAVSARASVRQRGEGNPHWAGGTSNNFRYGLSVPEYNALSQKVRERAGWACEKCGATAASGTRLHMHHRDGDKGHNCLENLVCLCLSCHTRTEAELRRQLSNEGHKSDAQGLPESRVD